MASVTTNITNTVPLLIYSSAYGSRLTSVSSMSWYYHPAFNNSQHVDLGQHLAMYNHYNSESSTATDTYRYYNTYYNCFYNNKNVVTVTNFNQNYVVDMRYCFRNCSNLISVTGLPKRASDMAYCFDNCQNLVQVSSLPNGKYSLCNAFKSCTNLINAPNIPNSVTDVSFAFAGCTNLNLGTVHLPIGNYTNYACVYNGIIPSGYQNILNVININQLKSYGGLFYGCNDLVDASTIEIHNNVKSLASTYYNCYNLVTPPTIPNSVTTMRETFCNCYNLTTAPVIPDSVTDLSHCFSGCVKINNFENIIIPNSVTNLYNTFKSCNLYNAIPAIPNNVISISGTFDNSTINGLNITIPDSVYTMSFCFRGCHSQEPIYGSNIHISNSVVDMSYCFWNVDSLVNVPVIPNSVMNLNYAFSNCANLIDGGVIPDSVISMSSCFSYCTNLVNAPVIPNSVISLQSAFNGCTNLNLYTVKLPSSEDLACQWMLGNLVKDANDLDKVDMSVAKNISMLFQNCIINSVNHISDSVLYMRNTFTNCTYLAQVNSLSNNVKILANCFCNCQKLTKAPDIPDSVTNMYRTFYNCKNLAGNMNMYAKNIVTASGCFTNVNNTLNIYLPFTYMNGEYTRTYNTFNGVYNSNIRLFDLNQQMTTQNGTFNLPTS